MKKILAFTSALLMAAASMSLTSCSSKESSSSSSEDYSDADVAADVREKIKDAALESDLLPDEELENKTIKWFANWDINPDSTGKTKPIELVLFEEKYHGKIEYVQIKDWNQRYEELSTKMLAGDGIDFFWGGDKDAIPRGALSDVFVPTDDYIDYDSPLWEDVKDLNDRYKWGDDHYLALVQATGDNVGCIYNRKTMEEAGLDDPADLYAQGKWDWNAFESMLQKFVDVDNQRYGVDGWWFQSAFMGTTGVPGITLEDGKLVDNLGDPAMERVQNFMFDIHKIGGVAVGEGDYGWEVHPEYVGEGKMLFYPVGLYELYKEPEQWKKIYGDDAFFVPMPKDPDADDYYIPVGMEAYTFIKGGANPQGVARFLDCKRFSRLNEDTRKLGDEQFRNDYGWTDEMVDMQNEMQRLADENPVIDFSLAVNDDCSTILDNELRASSHGTPWNETYDKISAQVEALIDDANGKK